MSEPSTSERGPSAATPPGRAGAGGAGPSLPPALRERLIVVDNFLPVELAEAMRLDIDNHFSNPGAHAPQTHQVWNYWYVPELYTYLRTQPEKVIRGDAMRTFGERLGAWSLQTLGLGLVTWPYLSLYVSGCRQGLHNDSANGRFGYVYSLTRNERKTQGGQTIVHHEGDAFRSLRSRPGAGRSFYDLVEPTFNRLVVFDDRMPHAVERLEGSMDPREGRFVLHGHIREGDPKIAGALAPHTVVEAATRAVADYAGSTFVDGYHGPLVLAVRIGESGAVASCSAILDRVVSADPADGRWPRVVSGLMAALAATSFPAAAGPTELLLPIAFGQKLRDA